MRHGRMVKTRCHSNDYTSLGCHHYKQIENHCSNLKHIVVLGGVSDCEDAGAKFLPLSRRGQGKL